MSDTPPVHQSQQDGCLTITLNRPDKLNAFNDEMHAILRGALQKAKDDDAIRSVLLTGAGRAFSAGEDLSAHDPDKRDGPPELGRTLEQNYNPLIKLMRDIPKPIVCAVNGTAAGAAANIAFACDVVLAAKSAKFIQAFSKIGLIPDAGGTWTVTHVIGEARAKSWMLTGEPITAEIAESWGLIWKAVNDDQLMDEATRLAQSFASGPTIGLGMTKRTIQAATTNDLDAQLDLERDTQDLAGRTPDHEEGVRAFLAKRQPVYTGRAS